MLQFDWRCELKGELVSPKWHICSRLLRNTIRRNSVVDIKLAFSVKTTLSVKIQKMSVLTNFNKTLESRSWHFGHSCSTPLIPLLQPYIDSRPHGLYVGCYPIPLLTRSLSGHSNPSWLSDADYLRALWKQTLLEAWIHLMLPKGINILLKSIFRTCMIWGLFFISN